MVPVMITSNRSKAGKVFFTIGLAQKLMQMGYKVGYMKPLGTIPVKQGHDIFDEDAVFIKDALGLTDPLGVISPFVLSYETQNQLLEGGLKDVKKQVMASFSALRERDFVLIHGAADIFEGTALGIDVLSLVAEMQARILMVEPWRGDISMDTIVGAKKLFAERFAGGVINKVPESLVSHVKETVRPFLEKRGVALFGVVQRDKVLDAITIRHIVEVLNGKVMCCEEKLDDFVENFSIGAMDVDSALSYFRKTPNKAVITGAHRTDIQLVALETSTKCLILTGGMHTSDVVISKATDRGIPVISVETDTFTTVDRIERVMGHTMIREKGKVARAKEIVSAEFDIERFIKVLS